MALPYSVVCADLGRHARQDEVVCQDGVVRRGKGAPGHGGDGRTIGGVWDSGDSHHGGGCGRHDVGVPRTGIVCGNRNSGGCCVGGDSSCHCVPKEVVFAGGDRWDRSVLVWVGVC